ncbi:MAG: fibronectin type III domain-containing protein, partial [Calditrichaeota bacterium]|nr:fibronectin type III domain-containing protein [Calditrichota bacterium]
VYGDTISNPGQLIDSLNSKQDTTFTVVGLINDRSYYFRLQAVDSTGNHSDFGAEVSATPIAPIIPDTIPPSVPLGLSGIAGDRQLQINWSANSESEVDFSYYLIFCSTSINPNTKIDSIFGRTQTTYTINSLLNGQRYYVRLKAVDFNGNVSDFSLNYSLSTLDRVAPLTPSNFTAQADVRKIRLNWQVSSEADFAYYKIYADTISNIRFAIDSLTNRNTSNYIHKHLNNRKTYHYKISAVDTNGNESSRSQTLSVQPIQLYSSDVIEFNPSSRDTISIMLYTNTEIKFFDTAEMSQNGLIENLHYNLENQQTNKLSTYQYKAKYQLKGSGEYVLRIHARTDDDDQIDYDKRYTALELNGQRKLQLIVPDQSAWIDFENHSLLRHYYLLVSSAVDLSGQSQIYSIYSSVPANLQFKLTIKINQNFYDIGKYFIYQADDQNWNRLNTQIYNRNSKLTAVSYINAPGQFKLAYDEQFTGSNSVPNFYSLDQNYPNPFNPGTTIQYNIANDGYVSLIIYNILGQQVRKLINGRQLAAARKRIVWDGKDDHGKQVASGIYIYQLISSDFSVSKRMLLLK